MSKFPLRRAVLAVVALVILATLGLHADVSRRDADLLKQKIAVISAAALQPPKQPRRTTVTEQEVNAYLAFDAKPQLPAGVVEPAVSIVGTGRLAGRAIVDLDAVRKQSAPASSMDPMNFLTGRLPITAEGTLTTSNGTGRFALESATLAGVPIPKAVLQQIVSYYSRTPDNPGGVSLDAPFPLPARIREIQVERGQAIIVQ